MKTPSHNGEKLELESFVCAVHTDSFGRKLFYDPHTHEQRPGVQKLLHARVRVAFDLVGSADGDDAASSSIAMRWAMPKRQSRSCDTTRVVA
jgi:hypothetical protein